MRDLKAEQASAEGVPAAAGHSLRRSSELERRPSALAVRGGVSDPRHSRSSSRSTCALSRSSTRELQRLEARAARGRCTRWRLYPVVEAIQALRGVELTGAVILVAELGRPHALRHPAPADELPRPHAFGVLVGRTRRRQGGITKAGNSHARRALVEGAWAYRYPAKVSRHLQLRLEKLPADDPGDRLEGAGASVQTVSSTDRPRQARQPSGGGDRPRDGRFRLGDRPHRAAGPLTGPLDRPESRHVDHDLEPSAARGPGIGAIFDRRYEATTLAPRAKQAPRRTPVRWYPIHGYQHDRPSQLQAPSLPLARVLTMKRARPGPGRVRAFRHRPTKPRAVEGSQSTIAKGVLIRHPPTEAHRATYDLPGVHEIRGVTHRRNGTPGPGVIVILDSGSHINAQLHRRPKAGRCKLMLGTRRLVLRSGFGTYRTMKRHCHEEGPIRLRLAERTPPLLGFSVAQHGRELLLKGSQARLGWRHGLELRKQVQIGEPCRPTPPVDGGVCTAARRHTRPLVNAGSLHFDL